MRVLLRTGLPLFILGVAVGLVGGRSLFVTTPNEAPAVVIREPTCPPAVMPRRAGDRPEPLIPASKTTPSRVLANAVPAVPDDGGNRCDNLRAELDFQAQRALEASGKRAVEAPPGLPSKFSNETLLRELWKAKLKGTRFADSVPVVQCDEYPCLARIQGPGVEDAAAFEGGLPAPFEGEQVSALFEKGSDGKWAATVAVIPAQEPSARVDVIAKRMIARRGISPTSDPTHEERTP